MLFVMLFGIARVGLSNEGIQFSIKEKIELKKILASVMLVIVVK